MRIANGGILMVTLEDWFNAGLTRKMYENAKCRYNIETTRACYGKPVEIVLDSLPDQYRSKFKDPRANAVHRSFRDLIEPDEKAVTFFSDYLLADGRHLKPEYIKEYTTNVNVLNAIQTTFKTQSNARKALASTMQGFWSRTLVAVNAVRDEYQHTLPSNEVALKRKYQKYIDGGYESVISGKFCNDNSRKVSADIERLILSLYTMDNKPFAAQVHILYKLFLAGSIQVIDSKTGEMFEPKNFIKNGEPIEISETTVWNYLNQPKNRYIVDSKRSGAFNFNNEHRPHHHRSAPMFAFSKISMDDRDLPRKLTDGKRVKAYYAYDVASGCVIGAAYSRNKDEELFLDCMRDMFRMIELEGLPMPLEVEVENHLVNKFFDELAIMFPFVRICRPGNSQEKHAEHFNKSKKYGVEKNLQNGIGRWWARSEAYRVDNDKVNDEFVEKTYTYERIVADDMHACYVYNNELDKKHAKKYPGKTRWQVLVENINAKAPQVNKAVAYKGIGNLTKTTINRNMYCSVQHIKFQLPSPAVISRLLPNNYEVDAYYLPTREGVINEVYLYQNNVFLCKCEPVETYSTAKAEWTDNDSSAFTKQSSYVSTFDKSVKEGKEKLAKITIMNPETMKLANQQEVVIVNETKSETDIAAILRNYNPEDYSDKANEQI